MAVCLGAVAWSNGRDRAHRRQNLENDTRVVASQFASRIKGGLELHRVGLQQMTNFWTNSEEVTEQEFYDFSAGTLKVSPLCLRLSAVDPSLRVRWVYPPEPNLSLVGFDLKTHPQGHETFLRAMQVKEPVLSAPLQLVGGAQGFALAAPIFRKGRFLGELVCSIRSADFFGSLILPEVIDRYGEMVLDSGTPLFASASFESSSSSVPPVAETFDLGGRTWEVRVLPREEVIRERLHTGQAGFWTLGWLLTLGVGCAAAGGTYWGSAIASHFRSQKAALSKTREQLDGAMRQLLQAEKLTALGELIAGVAHEINNPLSTIMGYSQLLMGGEFSEEVRKRRLETVHSEAERMAKIVKNLLTFARKHPPEKKFLGLNGIIEKTLELKTYHFRASQIEVEKDLDPDLPRTMLDFHQMQQVIINLLNNAEQALIESGRRGRIRIETRVRADRIVTRVSDNGPGMPLEIQERIFEPFFTTKQEGKGTGVGLSLCYGITREHGGTIRVESRPGEGASFIIELPVIQDTAVLNEEAPSAQAQPMPSLRILVVDDELALQDFLVDLLGSRGHRVDTASDVPEALRKIAINGHDLIISDMKMPHGSGKDIFKAVTNKSPRLARRIVFTTGDGASAETERFLKETGNEIVLKPFKIQEIETAITKAIKPHPS